MQISMAESVVMEALWRKSPRSAEAVAAEVAGEQSWTEATVKTLLNRLLKKGAIAADKEGRRYLYRPVLRRDQYVSHESQSLIDRLFGGRVSSLLMHFSERDNLSADDIAELKRLVAELEDDDR